MYIWEEVVNDIAKDVDKFDDCYERLSKVKAQLILAHPFFGTLAMNMKFRVSREGPTAMTNGVEVVFNPDFIRSLTNDELKFLVTHEISHPMFDHCERKRDKDHEKWNIATDYIINQILVDEKIGVMPKIGLQDKELYDKAKGVSENVYALLPPTVKNKSPNGIHLDSDGNSLGEALDSVESSASTEAEKAQRTAEWKIKVTQARNSAKIMGKLSANLERLVGGLLESRVDWREVLQRFVIKQRTDDRTFARFNRRFISQGLYLPSISGEGLGELVFAIDTSGSIGQAELDQFASEIIKVWEEQRPTKIHVLYFDSDVCHADEFDKDTEPTFAPHGGGGTAFSPVFKYMQENDIDPVACIFLTDMCSNDYGDTPSMPVLWISTYENYKEYYTPPFGDVVVMHKAHELNQY